MSRTLRLTHGLEATVDDDTYERLKHRLWRTKTIRGYTYAVTSQREGRGTDAPVRVIYLHREVIGFGRGYGPHVTFRNGDRLDCRRENLTLFGGGDLPTAPAPTPVSDGPARSHTPWSRWTDDRAAEAARLAVEVGLSCSQIAKQLGHGLTRNAVIGKLNRMGVSRLQPTAPRGPRGPYRPRAPKPTTQVHLNLQRRPLPPLTVADATPDPVRLLDSTASRCLYPLDEPTAEMTVCGARRERGKYCAAHAAVAYRPTPPANEYARSIRRWTAA